MPDTLPYEEGAAVNTAFVTAWGSLMGGIRPLRVGDSVLLQGIGGVSIAALQIAVAPPPNPISHKNLIWGFSNSIAFRNYSVVILHMEQRIWKVFGQNISYNDVVISKRRIWDIERCQTDPLAFCYSTIFRAILRLF